MPSLTPTSISYPFKHPSRLLPTPAIHYKLNKFFGNSGGGGGRNEWCLGLGRDLWRDSCTSPFPPTSPNKKIDNIVWVRGVGPSGGPLAPGPLRITKNTIINLRFYGFIMWLGRFSFSFTIKPSHKTIQILLKNLKFIVLLLYSYWLFTLTRGTRTAIIKEIKY